jgi:hypothetical protein
MARDGTLGGFRYLHLVPDEPREPDEWWVGAFICALFEPPPPTPTIRAPAPYRVCRPLSRTVKLKSGRRETWSIARAAVPTHAWAFPPCRPQATDRPESDRDFLDRVRARFTVLHKREMLGLLTPDQRGLAIRSTERVICRRMIERSPKPMCQPVHSGRALVAVRRGMLLDKRAIWIKLPPFRRPHGLLPAFTRRDWIYRSVRNCEVLAQQTGKELRESARGADGRHFSILKLSPTLYLARTVTNQDQPTER